MQTTTPLPAEQITWEWRPGTDERMEALDRLIAALDDYRDAGGSKWDWHTRSREGERLWLALLDMLDLAADDLRARRAAR